MTKSGTNLFVFSNKDDIEKVDIKDVVAKLQPPLSVNNRGHYKFNDELFMFKNLG